MIYKSIVSLMIVLSLLFTVSCGSKKYDKPTILLITVESMRPDHLGVYGYQRDAAPFINSLAKAGLVFKRTVTPQPLTSGGNASILTSLHPITHNLTYEGRPLSENTQTIAEVLQKNGYYTIGTVSVNLLTKKQNFSQGFDSFSDTWEKHPDDKFKGTERRIAKSVNDSLFQQIAQYQADEKNKNKPLFIWVHYYDQRAPITNWDAITFEKKLPGEMEENKRIKRYDKELRYTDDAVKALHKYLEEKKLNKGLVTCLTSNTGEQLGEHGYRDGNYDVYGETTHVPLIFNGYDIPEGKVIDTYTSTMDVAVSLLGMAKLNFDYPTEGIDLLKILKTDDAKFPERKFLILGTQKFTRSIQLMGAPFDYILNCDNHYKYWYGSLLPQTTSTVGVEEKRFSPIAEKKITQKGNLKIVSLPQVAIKSLGYLVFRGDVASDSKTDILVKVVTHPDLATDPVPFVVQAAAGKKQNPLALEIIYPVIIGDRPALHITLAGKSGATVTNFRYVYVPASELAKTIPQAVATKLQKQIENPVWKTFHAKRKVSPKDELFDVSQNKWMMNNQSGDTQYAELIREYKDLIYKAFEYYTAKRALLLKGTLTKKELKGSDDKMLKLLGY